MLADGGAIDRRGVCHHQCRKIAMTSSTESVKQAAQAWVDQAIACGANPRMILEHPSKRLSVHTAVEGVDWTTHPGRLPDHLVDDVFDILNSMGRVEDLKPASEGDGPP